MKISHYIFFTALLITALPSCKKEYNSVKTVPMSSLTLINAVVNSDPIIADFNAFDSLSVYYNTAPQVGYQSSYEFSVISGNTPTEIYQVSDTTNPLFKHTLSLEPNAIYSLFLTGTANSQNGVDTLLTIDKPLYHSDQDSTMGLRFVNLSQGPQSISINLLGNPDGSEVPSLNYKSITNFKTYAASSNFIEYTFEIKDAASGTLLTTYTYTVTPFQNVTMVVSGAYDSTNNSISAFLVNNF